METIIVTSKEHLRSIIQETMNDIEDRKGKKLAPKLYTINQVAKMLGKAHGTIKKLVAQGYFKTTKSGLITEQSINDYLENQ